MGYRASNFSNRQLAVNMLSGIVVFAVNLCISFFLTPYIVRTLGSAAYGFIGLSNNIVGYSSLLTVAINSMAGRFITIAVHSGDQEKANVYISSVFFTNVVFSAIIMVVVGICAFNLERLINIPDDLIFDVKVLFVLLGISTCLSLFTGLFAVSCFVCNRLDMTNIRNIIGNILRAVMILMLFGLCIPRLWYFGLTAVVMQIYLIVVNMYIYKRLTPELLIRKVFFSVKAIIRITASGAWNILNKISSLLTRGCELLLANLFVSAKMMGLFSIAFTIPMLLVSLFGGISNNFAPELTRHYAHNQPDQLKEELFKSIRICSFLSAVPLALIYVLGDLFFALWVPGQDTLILYALSAVGSMELICGLSQEPLWNIFVITDNVKGASLYQFFNAVLTFATILALMYMTHDDIARIMIIAGIHSLYCVIRNLTFLPIYGAKCLELNRAVFYPVVLRSVLNVMIVIAFGFAFKYMFFGAITITAAYATAHHFNWLSLLACAGCITGSVAVISNFIMLRAKDRLALMTKIRKVMS